MAYKKKLVSIAICTYNRAWFLNECLKSVTLSNKKTKFPVIIVDNNSNDKTSDILKKYHKKNFHIFQEKKQGLSYARNKALKNAKTKYIVYIDDDGKAARNWCKSISQGIVKYNPDVFGGPFRPFYKEKKPKWFLDKFGSSTFGKLEGQLKEDVCFNGGNMGWRVALLKKAKGFPTHLGMNGIKLGLGEETFIQKKLHKNKKIRFVYLPKMLIRHYVAPSKMSLAYIFKRSFIYGFQIQEIDPESEMWKRQSIIKFLKKTKAGLPIILRLFIRNKAKYKYWKTYLAQYFSLHCMEFGALFRRYIFNLLYKRDITAR